MVTPSKKLTTAFLFGIFELPITMPVM
jgi:hypothetical protein